MTKEIIIGLTLPFLGTALGAACALFMKGQLGHRLQRGLMAFAAGVMVAASIWSLLLPALDHAQRLGVWSFVPATGGFWIGILFLLYGYFRAVNKPVMSVVLTVISLGTRVLLAYTLSSVETIGVIGIWVAIPIGWFLADAAGLLHLRSALAYHGRKNMQE